MASKLELMELQAKALFTHDEDNFIRNINELNGAEAPRFFYGRTPEGNVLRFRWDLPKEVIKKLKNIVSREPACCDLPRNTVLMEEIKEVLQEHKGIQKIYEGPAYRLVRGIAFPMDVMRITQDNVNILKDSFDYMITELQYWEPCYAKIVNGKAVSLCFSSRMADKSHEAGVETLLDYRGRGYAAEVAAAWAEAIYDMNRIPTYSTSWDNAASQSVARKLKCEMYGVDLSIF